MPRFRFFDVDDSTAPVDWRIPAAILSTLFLNAAFWLMDGDSFARFSTPLAALAICAVAALLCAGLFFLGPALAAQSARSFPSMLSSGFGTVPGFLVQIVCVIYLVIWISKLLALVCWWLQPVYYPQEPAIQYPVIACAVLLFVGLTSCQSITITAALARFSVRLGAAILIAALIRVRSGWFAIPMGFQYEYDRPPVQDLWRGFSNLGYYAAPVALLAAVFVTRLSGKKAVGITALMGLALPLAGSLAIVTAINVATHASSFYRPSIPASVAMALVSGVARAREKAILLILALTILAALRFGMSALKEVAAFRWIPPRPGWVLFGCLFSAIVWLSAHSSSERIEPIFELCSQCLAAVCAIFTVDAITRGSSNWSATLGLLCGIGIPAFLRFWRTQMENSWGHPWLLPSYAIAFAVHLLLSKRGARRLLSFFIRVDPRLSAANKS